MKDSLNSKTMQNFTKCIIVFIMTSAVNLSCWSQVSSTDPFNLPAFGTADFLGWDATVNTYVSIRHLTPSESIIFKTNGQERMQILPNDDRTILIEAQAADNAKLRITQDS